MRVGLTMFMLLLQPASAQSVAPDASSDADVVGERIHRDVERRLRPRYTAPHIDDRTKTTEAAADGPPPVAFELREVRLDGNTKVPTDAFDPVIQPFLHQPVSFEDLTQLTDGIEQLYRQHGYVTTVAYLPPQDIMEGRVTIVVLEGLMGSLRVEDATFSSPERIKWYWRTTGGEPLRYQDIFRSVARMNEHPDRQVQALLMPGPETGTTDVMLRVTEERPFHTNFSIDRQGTKSIGRFRYGAGITHNNLFGIDDRLSAGTVFGQYFGAVYVQYQVPVTQHGTTLVGSFTHSQTSPKRHLTAFGVNGTSQTYGFSVRQPLYDGPTGQAEVRVGLDMKDSRTMVQSGTSRRDRIRAIRIEPQGRRRDRWGAWYADSELAFGLNALGATSQNNPVAGRDGAKPDFVKAWGQLTRLFYLPWGTLLSVQTTGQLASTKLLPQEQLYLGGANAVRGYPEGDYLADVGVMVRSEYMAPFRFLPDAWRMPWSERPVKEELTFVGFLDYAYGRLRGALPGERASRNMWGVGVGVRYRVARDLYARLEFGWNIGDEPLTDDSPTALHFALQYQY